MTMPYDAIYIGTTDYQVRWGGNDDPRPHLTVGQRVRIIDHEVHSWHTKVVVEGLPGLQFNSVSFQSPKAYRAEIDEKPASAYSRGPAES